MKKITIHNKNYTLVSDFKDCPTLRASFNALAKNTFDFDFETYYQSGYWNERYIPYALLDGDKVVANVAANILKFSVLGEEKSYIQIGTVMTDVAYRNRGLSKFLLEFVIAEWQDRSDLIYLFANDSVLDFYPKFGFFKKSEHQYTKSIFQNSTDFSVQHLDMHVQKNRDLLHTLSYNTCAFSKLCALQNTALVMFYATSFMAENVYYLDALEAAVFAEYKEDTLYLNDIFCRQPLDLDQVISIMTRPNICKVVLGFTPIHTVGYHCESYLEEDSTLFVLADGATIFDWEKVMLPILSHA